MPVIKTTAHNTYIVSDTYDEIYQKLQAAKQSGAQFIKITCPNEDDKTLLNIANIEAIAES